MSSLAPGPIHCVSCRSEVARHPWFVGKRVRELTCPHCGAQLEVSIPAWPHYLTAILIALIGQVAALALVIFFLFRSGWPTLLAIAALSAIELGRSAWLRSRSTVRWLNRRSMERKASGAWVPE
jgi:hypothetical protein